MSNWNWVATRYLAKNRTFHWGILGAPLIEQLSIVKYQFIYTQSLKNQIKDQLFVFSS